MTEPAVDSVGGGVVVVGAGAGAGAGAEPDGGGVLGVGALGAGVLEPPPQAWRAIASTPADITLNIVFAVFICHLDLWLRSQSFEEIALKNFQYRGQEDTGGM